MHPRYQSAQTDCLFSLHHQLFSRYQRRWLQGLILFSLALIWVISPLWLPPAHAYTDAQFQTMAQTIAPDLASRTGHPLTKPVYVTTQQLYQDSFALQSDDTAETIPVVQRNQRWIDPRDEDASASQWSACLIVLADGLETQDGLKGIRSIIAHELYHCYQFERVGIQRNLPQWLLEGSAMWVGEDYVGGTAFSGSYWKRYLANRTGLYDRDYDAMGFFAHLKNRGANVFQALNSILDASDPEASLIAAAQATGEEAFLRTWATGLARQSSWGSEWDTTGPAITNDRRNPTHVNIPADISFQGANPDLVSTGLPSGKVIQIQSQLYGGLRFGDGNTSQIVNLSPGFNQRYCVGESCRCPDGSTPSGINSVPADLTIAGVSGLQRSLNRSVTLTVTDPDCNQSSPNNPNNANNPNSGGSANGAAPNWGGGDQAQGTSYGDPHIITYDGYRYSFQTVGEFVLTQTTDRRFVVQTRQAQVPGQSMSLNVATAAHLGNHRIGIYAQTMPDDNTPLWVDGTATTLDVNERLTLDDGVQISCLGDLDYFLQGPRDETVTIKGITSQGARFINVTPAVSRSHRQAYQGLLGNLNGSASDDLQLRNGQVVPSQDAYAPVTQLVSGLLPAPIPLSQLETAFFDQLYRQFGDSWRLTSAESLFDYGPNQTTETFTNRGFPQHYPSLVGVAPSRIQAATRTCQDAGVEAALLEGCVFDVAATGNQGFAAAAANAVVTVALDRVRDRILDQIQPHVPFPISIPGFPF